MDDITTEKAPSTFEADTIEDAKALKLDKHGLPLSPQPSDSPSDPLNWPWVLKLYITILVSLLGFMAQFGIALVNPAFVIMSKELDVTVEQASYCTTVGILFSGFGTLAIVPFAHVYGRRICYLIAIIIGFVGAFVSAAAPTYGGVLGGRVLYGIGGSVPLGIATATICDLFTQGERGVYMGIYTVMVANGPHVAPIAGGYITEQLGWRWCFWIPGFILAGLWILLIFTFPETLYSREDHNRLENKTSYVRKLLFHGKVLQRRIRPRDFLTSMRMAQYLAVLFPALWYMTCNVYGSLLFAVTGAHIGTSVYGFRVEQIGLFLGIALTVGCFLGEMSAGWVSGMIVTWDAKRRGCERRPEARLYLLPACTLLGLGTALYGWSIQEHNPWIVSAVMMAISGFGSQVGTTMVYTYTTDAYKPQSGEIGAVINLFRAIFGFNIGFYALPFAEATGYTTAFSALGGINLVLLIPIAVLVFKGEEIRRWQGQPQEHADI